MSEILRLNRDQIYKFVGDDPDAVRIIERLLDTVNTLQKDSLIPTYPIELDELIAPNPFPTILHERGYSPLTVDDALNSRITPVNSAVNTLNYTHWTTIWNYHYMGEVIPMTKTYNKPNPASDNFMIVEFPITVGQDNMLWLKLGDSSWAEVLGWVVHPTDGSVIKLLGQSVTTTYAETYSGATIFPGPDGERDHPSRYHYWHNFPVSASDVTQYKTATNTIKIAITPGASQTDARLHPTGIASSTNPWGLVWSKGTQLTGWNAYGHTNSFVAYGHYEEGYMTTTSAGGVVNGFRIPILDTTSDIIVGFIKSKGNSYTGAMQWDLLGSGLPTLTYYESFAGKGMLANYIASQNVSLSTRGMNSIMITQEIVEQYAKTDPVKGFHYLEFNARNQSNGTTYYHAIYTEKHKNRKKILALYSE